MTYPDIRAWDLPPLQSDLGLQQSWAFRPSTFIRDGLLVNIHCGSMFATLADADDPTYTHFAHKEAFFELLASFLAIDVSRAPGRREEIDEEVLVKKLGAIVSCTMP
jgi:hypothetical protein